MLDRIMVQQQFSVDVHIQRFVWYIQHNIWRKFVAVEFLCRSLGLNLQTSLWLCFLCGALSTVMTNVYRFIVPTGAATTTLSLPLWASLCVFYLIRVYEIENIMPQVRGLQIRLTKINNVPHFLTYWANITVAAILQWDKMKLIVLHH